MTQVTAFAPGNVSTVFQIIPDKDPRRMHSLGMGFTIADGVRLTIAGANSTKIYFNGREIEFPTVRTVIERLCEHPINVVIDSQLPLSGGFGLSGASALATALALDTLLDARLPREELGMIAHVAEVCNLTGLGDVCGQFHGGCNIKTTPGAPLTATPLPILEQPIWYRYFSPILTCEIIGDPERQKTINRAAHNVLILMTELAQAQVNTFEPYIRAARQFAEASGLLTDPRVRDTITRIQRAGGEASMIMLGNAVFSTMPFAGATQTRLSTGTAYVLT